jgi:DNA-binding NtrC family response regulator
MNQLDIFRQGERILSLTLDKNLIRIGRSAPAEIELPDPSLSREHCVLVKKERGWFIEDSSKNGVHSDTGIKIDGRTPLETGLRYKIGRMYSFEINEGRAASKERTILLSKSPTQLISVDRKRNKIILGKAEVSGRLSDGTKVKKPVGSDGLTIGSHLENDLQLVSDAVSQFHSRIDLIDNAFILSDLSSTNGCFVDGTRIIKAPLHDGAKIQIGPFEFLHTIVKEEIHLEPKETSHFFDLVSKNKAMRTAFATVEVVSATDASVVIHGETGTGKELIAKAIHQLSCRDAFPFVAINCASLPKDLVESELFGHEEGAFTGASNARVGAFEAAHQGSLFLDEIAELDLNVQAKLLRALETKEIKRLGSAHVTPISLRVIAASHKDLLEEVRKGLFREDLFYRLQVVQIELPPLRDRLEDLDLLIPELLSQLNLNFEVDAEVYELLSRYSFPGNIRELKNMLQRAVIEFEVRSVLKDKIFKKKLTAKDFDFMKRSSTGLLSLDQSRERDRLTSALKSNHYIQIKTAKALGIPLSTLNDKIRRYGIDMARS